jgi:hypothetical protein
MPGNYRLRLHDNKCVGPARPKTAERYPEEPIEAAHFRACLFAFEDSQLMAKRGRLQPKVMPLEKVGAKLSQHCKTEPDHSSDLKRLWMAFTALFHCITCSNFDDPQRDWN